MPARLVRSVPLLFHSRAASACGVHSRLTMLGYRLG
jgi:hypothetical protein